MEESFVRETLIDRMRRHRESLEEAARSVADGFRLDYAALQPAIDSIRHEGSKNMLLDSPSGVHDRRLEEEISLSGWYTGPEKGDEFWPRLRSRMELGALGDVIDEVDQASTKVVAHCADPNVRRLKKRGLVVGYVQSGKTANYTAVAAKAADAGYQLFIVLAGMHNNLRRQTQVRLSQDLLDEDWAPLTTDDADFGTVLNGAAMLRRGTRTIAVVKKNQARLRALRDWLRDIPEETRARVPVMMLDDEADQATPNSATGREELSRINQLLRQIWREIPTGTYVGYTATPFANVFMNPHDEEELYPADFIIDLPRPPAYFGAERVFGRQPLSDDDEPDPGLDMVREVPDEEAEAVRPPSKKHERASFDPGVPASLREAVLWFVVATAIRHARGQTDKHSSMLVHTTHYVQPHFAMKRRLDDLLEELKGDWAAGWSGDFHRSFREESERVDEVATRPLPEWTAVAEALSPVLDKARVVVDNGVSEDRLDYERKDADGRTVPDTVIAVGGGTLSRGLTLEGLVVSYFARTSNTYDTLLQMGRWFGFRPGYEDLPRIWMPSDLADEFAFLSLIEEEIRQDMRHFERMRVTPRELGVRVRSHPGRLAIVARNKMRYADAVRVSYSGQRLQTFIFDEVDTGVIAGNLRAAQNFISTCGGPEVFRKDSQAPRWYCSGVSPKAVRTLLESYKFHPNQASFDVEHIGGWIERAAADRPWNVVVKGSARRQTRDGAVLDLGTVDLGFVDPVPAVNRAPLKEPHAGTANIKALLSHSDWYADLDPRRIQGLSKSDLADGRAVRREHAEGSGLVIIYPVSRHSVPIRAGKKADSRREMQAPEHLIGIGLIFPDVDRAGVMDEGTYYSVHPDWAVTAEEEDDLPQDREGVATFDGDAMARGQV